MSRIDRLAFSIACAVLLAAGPAFATFHLWTIEEAFSNADGTIQYIEFQTTSNFQEQMTGHVLQAKNGATVQHSFTFLTNLPNNATANKFFLVATPAFAAVAGITPDYVLPPAKFIEFNTTNTLTLVGAVTPSFVFTPSALPRDGIHSLVSVGGVVGPALASPTNFAGLTGTMEPACSDTVDNDGDGFVDFPADIGCHDALWSYESPACQDGIDNDLDGNIDFDGGASLNGGVPLAPIDPPCAGKPYKNKETTGGCGGGEELAVIAPIAWIAGASRRRKR
jgi:hypothetical protein